MCKKIADFTFKGLLRKYSRSCVVEFILEIKKNHDLISCSGQSIVSMCFLMDFYLGVNYLERSVSINSHVYFCTIVCLLFIPPIQTIPVAGAGQTVFGTGFSRPGSGLCRPYEGL